MALSRGVDGDTLKVLCSTDARSGLSGKGDIELVLVALDDRKSMMKLRNRMEGLVVVVAVQRRCPGVARIAVGKMSGITDLFSVEEWMSESTLQIADEIFTKSGHIVV